MAHSAMREKRTTYMYRKWEDLDADGKITVKYLPEK
jgi:hypothetical protein